MDEEILRRLINEDQFGLLKPSEAKAHSRTVDQRIRDRFEEIRHFVKVNGRLPRHDTGETSERVLGERLRSFRSDPELRESLKDYDPEGILGITVNVPESVDEARQNDPFGLLEERSDIFNLRHVKRRQPEEVARRQPCRDFAKYEGLFAACKAELKTGKRQLRGQFMDRYIAAGNFFILKGIMLYIAEEGEVVEMIHKVPNRRLLVIFENGTESNMLSRSLGAELYKDGKRITDGKHLFSQEGDISSSDIPGGWIYIVQTLSKDPVVQNFTHLYKIGFTRSPVEERFKGVHEEPTFLCSPVKVMRTYECHNIDANGVEALLHRFFASSCIEIQVIDSLGKAHRPREWFAVPIDTISEAIELLLTGDLPHYRYDHEHQQVVPG